MQFFEVNFDAIVGPTHHYGGLAWGNLASQRHKHSVSSPRRAALEGLAKMKRLADRGVPQAVLPPQLRPDLGALRRLGFTGDDRQVLASVAAHDSVVLAACSSASAMWAANAATVSPSPDCADGRVHFTPANLVSQFHRSLEPRVTAGVLKAIFADPLHFAHHDPLPAQAAWADEGAANHTRLGEFSSPGKEIFVFGRDERSGGGLPQRFPARQTRAAGEAIARLHQLDPGRTLFLRQNPVAIDAGVFHNDVICVGHRNLLLYHEQAFLPADDAQLPADIERLKVSVQELSLSEAVETYLFNSQLVTLPDGKIWLIAPAECQTHPAAKAVIDRLVGPGRSIAGVEFVDVRQSMQNGGGPACLRLRVVLSEAERKAVSGRVFLDDGLYSELTNWVEQFYRDELRGEDLADPHLLGESRDVLDALAGILGLPINVETQM
jgi:succinylarginine dihydrolase